MAAIAPRKPSTPSSSHWGDTICPSHAAEFFQCWDPGEWEAQTRHKPQVPSAAVKAQSLVPLRPQRRDGPSHPAAVLQGQGGVQTTDVRLALRSPQCLLGRQRGPALWPRSSSGTMSATGEPVLGRHWLPFKGQTLESLGEDSSLHPVGALVCDEILCREQDS